MFVGINLGINLRSSVSFSPSALFAAGEPGVWFDPSDVANLDWRYNLLLWTQEFDNPFWAKQAGTVVTANQAVAPDGTTTADLVVSNGTNGIFTSGIAVPSVSANTKSIWLRGVSGGEVVQLKDPNLTIGTITCNLTTSWQRFSLPEIQTGGLAGLWVANIPAGGIYMWGAQLELGTVATTYQPITTVDAGTLERFPNATLYQDPAGTTPVTTPGQAVGLMLDKSKGLALGAELVANGDFSNGSTGWTVSAQCSIGSGVANIISTDGSFQSVVQNKTLTGGSTYELSFDVVSFTSGNPRFTFTGASVDISFATGTGRRVARFFVPTTVTSGLTFTRLSGVTSYSIDNISVRELAGNHATQITPAARPTYAIEPAGGRRNSITYSQDFSFWPITGSATKTLNQIAPDGSFSAAKVVFAISGLGNRITSPTTAGAPIGTQTTSVWLRGEVGGELISVADGWGGVGNFTLTTSWVRYSYSFTPNISAGLYIYATSGTPTAYVWGGQLENGTTATIYQKVGSQYDVTQAGKPSMSYLYFDGVNDAMATSTITPGIDKAQVFAGVKFTAAVSNGTILETSIAADGNVGAFYLRQKAGGVEQYLWVFRSTTSASAVLGYTLPEAAVLTATSDFAAPQTVERRNGVQFSSAIAPAVGGVFGNYPLYIGGRAGASLFASFSLYSQITRFGPNLPDTTITSTERWVAGKTGFYPPIITGVPTIGVS